MTPDKRLGQIEPVLSDVVQKVDRLIETNGQILDLAVKNESTGRITANGLAGLTVKVNQIASDQAELRQEVQQIASDQAGLRQEVQQIASDQAGLRQEVQQGFQEINQRFDQLVSLIQERLK